MVHSHGAIRSLINALRHAKDGTGTVGVFASHWWPEDPETRSVIAAPRKNSPSGSPSQIAPAPPEVSHPEDPHATADGFLRIGEKVEFLVESPMDGFLHLFNLGTSGSCLRLCPSASCPGNRIEAGGTLRLPADALPESTDRNLGFPVSPPTTMESGEPERLLAVVTRKDLELSVEDLHADLLDRAEERRWGFSAPPRVEKPRLFRLPTDQWEYGLLQMEVRD